ncbi:glycosyltransferase family 8 protein [Paracoccus siganidrum]|uniref:Glycosyltransferase family 8 protein n=1 Tax=Paracoccus siganidrum TaxID=1276757 RepID=A0A419A8D1_9RHOB|nr:glycosyltransferase family 8 protein [Paracoccus siganidrum]RJL18349.1 glycosyltransferase family 8 protein [Paracoccus siganidrum]RMC31513.1 hypothetical protein C9E82_15880 [Paracoccus siganidrum]
MLIITGSDDNYVPGVLVLVASAAFHNPDARFAVLDMGISPENRARIDRLAERLQVDIQRVEVGETAFSGLMVKRRHLTCSTYLRLLIPQLFPAEDRVIYMDCDMVVMDDLSPLNEVELGRNIVAAVPCPSPDPIEVNATGHVIGSYVNAGLLVMNLPVWRAEKVADLCVACLSDPQKPLLSEDQSAINIVARDRMTLLPLRFNVYSDPASYKRPEDFPHHPAVLHYVVNNKPWNWQTNLAQIWQFHADRIADLLPPRRPISIRRRLSLFNRERKQVLGQLTMQRKYCVRRKVVRYMNEVVAREYLEKAAAAAR